MRISFLTCLSLFLLVFLASCIEDSGITTPTDDCLIPGNSVFEREELEARPEFGYVYTHEEAQDRYRHSLIFTQTDASMNGDLFGSADNVIEVQLISSGPELTGVYEVVSSTASQRVAGVRFDCFRSFNNAYESELNDANLVGGNIMVEMTEEGFEVSVRVEKEDEFDTVLGCYSGSLQVLADPMDNVPNNVSDTDFGPENIIDFKGTPRSVSTPFFEVYSPTLAYLYIPIDSIDVSTGEPLGMSDVFRISNLHPLNSDLTGRYYTGAVQGATTDGYIDNRYGTANRAFVRYCLGFDFTAGRTCQVRESPRMAETVIRMNDDSTIQIHIDIVTDFSDRHVIDYSGPYNVLFNM